MAATNDRLPQIGDEVNVTIDSMAFGGEGVARFGGYVIFVPDVMPGEKVTIRITSAKRSYGRGVPAGIIEPSPNRVEPSCSVYGICGGCQYQHVAYEKTLEFKHQQLKEIMQRLGGLTVEGVCEAIGPSPRPYAYRNVVSLRLRKAERGWEPGYCARDNKTFVAVSHCPIAVDPINEAIADVGSLLSRLEHIDRIKDLTIKSAAGRAFTYPRYDRPFRLRSHERLEYRYGDLVLRYGLSSFFQVNHSMIPNLLELVSDGLGSEPRGTLFDLYAGVGLFSIALAQRFDQVIGIELARESVTCFEENIKENRRDNVTAVHGSVEARLRSTFGQHKGAVNTVLVDPPREGMTKGVIQFLIEEPIGKLVYVSCDPSTLARDLRMLSPAYDLQRITPLDMFPQTKHLEAVAVLERRA